MKDNFLMNLIIIIFSSIIVFSVCFTVFAYQAGFFQLVVIDPNKKPEKKVSLPEIENMLAVLDKEREVAEKGKKELELKKAETEQFGSQIEVEQKNLETQKEEMSQLIEQINKALAGSNEEFKKKCAQLAKIYSSMKPDKVALVLEKMDDVIVVGILSQMKPKISAKVLEKMKPSRAGILSAKIR